MNIQVFGQFELEEHIRNGGEIYSHLISIGNPGFIRRPDHVLPKLFKQSFSSILRLRFYDVRKKEQLGPQQKIKRIPKKKDVKRVIKFFEKTKYEATGYNIHCWQGVSRSTAVALILLYLIYEDEGKASKKLVEIRRQAMPNKLIVTLFDEMYNTNLGNFSETVYKHRIEAMKEEILNSLPVEELESVE